MGGAWRIIEEGVTPQSSNYSRKWSHWANLMRWRLLLLLSIGPLFWEVPVKGVTSLECVFGK